MTAAILVLALVLAGVNGMHDASNAVSTSIVTRALTERAALTMAAVLNLLGAAIGLGLAAWTMPRALGLLTLPASGAVTAGDVGHLQILLLSATTVAIAWELLTWWWGMPSSTWHAVLGAAGGAALPLGLGMPWRHELLGVALPILLSPVLGCALSLLLIHGLGALMARRAVSARSLRAAQTVSAGAVAAGHGINDVRLPAAIIAAALGLASLPAAGGLGALTEAAPREAATGGILPWWAVLLLALALSGGTLLGGRRVIRTLGRRLTDLSSVQGLAAESSAALILYAATLGLGVPVSTTHTVTAGIVGAGWAVGPRTVRWAVVTRIAATWVATPVVCGVLAAGVALLLRAV